MRPSTAGGMLVGLALGAACAGVASLTVGPATLSGLPLPQQSTSAPRPGDAAGQEPGSPLVPAVTSGVTTSSSQPAPTRTPVARRPVDTGANRWVPALINQAGTSAGCVALVTIPGWTRSDEQRRTMADCGFTTTGKSIPPKG